MHVVVTGGAGFIGANLVHGLRRQAMAAVTVVDDLSSGSRRNLAGLDGVRWCEGSVLDADLLDHAVGGADAVVHLAAVPSVPRSVADPVTSHQANATGTVAVLEAARRAGNPLVIVASSSSVYGANPTLPKHEELAPEPLSPYAASKLASESYALAYQAVYGVPVLAFRFFNVFGPLQPAGQRQEVGGVALRGHGGVGARREPLQGVLAQQVEHAEAGLVAALLLQGRTRLLPSSESTAQSRAGSPAGTPANRNVTVPAGSPLMAVPPPSPFRGFPTTV